MIIPDKLDTKSLRQRLDRELYWDLPEKKVTIVGERVEVQFQNMHGLQIVVTITPYPYYLPIEQRELLPLGSHDLQWEIYRTGNHRAHTYDHILLWLKKLLRTRLDELA